ncbi:phosphoglycerate mutase family protein [Aspergillus flavus]|uniref:Phosphoglycerate mutase family protein n=1 Tax=Aspergillus flavus TaxID=5059 RepID=A0AB74CEG7_ASPFL|nr:phosphoglycerate mutase family protein [Aspergillus flavus]RAQ69757.1 phosphoglycerate mutase family protein [Aspergillus flavus]RMZ43681.1 phosphoglycerate mutase family protein [Aspergillus flavus]
MATTLYLYLHLVLFSAFHGLTYASYPPTVYLIRHGEKPGDPLDSGLNADGWKRAECVREVFGEASPYDIGYIMAPHINKSKCSLQLYKLPLSEHYTQHAKKTKGEHRRSYETVHPLATDLGLTVDTSCKRNKVHCVAEAVNDYDGPGNILISWRHGKMRELVQALGYDDPPEYPEDRFDLIWTIPFPYDNITDIRSEDCPVLDVPEELAVDL